MTGRELQIPASDGRLLAGTLFEPEAATSPLTVIAAGAGIPRRYYARFATFLAGRGRPTLTFDYRDVSGSRGGSLKGSKVRMRDWCILDAAGVLAWAAAHNGGRPVHWVGHSMGGFATGLAADSHLIARQLNVATLSGYWRHMAVPERYRVLADHSIWRVRLKDAGATKIGHHGFFRDQFRDTLWPAAADWLDGKPSS